MIELADRITAHAQATRRRAGEIGAAVGAVHWRGTAADAFYGQANVLISGLHSAAGRLEAAADALRRHAYRVLEKLEQLADLTHDLGSVGSDVAHGVGDTVLRPQRLLADGVSVFCDGSAVVRDVAKMIGSR
jgi:ABC-type transporter Mla subunit MlaD